jgi:hypothetical protein
MPLYLTPTEAARITDEVADTLIVHLRFVSVSSSVFFSWCFSTRYLALIHLGGPLYFFSGLDYLLSFERRFIWFSTLWGVGGA